MVLGIDLGTSGVRVAVIDQHNNLLHSQATPYRTSLRDPRSWQFACRDLIQSIPVSLRQSLVALAVDGTSGTLLACDRHGAALGPALTYAEACPEHAQELRRITLNDGPAASVSGSLARALRLIHNHGLELLLRHQADWISGWFLQDWRWGEEGNNLRLGWDLEARRWLPGLESQPWSSSLPLVRPSGCSLGLIASDQAERFDLPRTLQVIAGTTDSNAAVLAADPQDGDGMTVLGTTLVVKRFTSSPISAPGVTAHRVDGRWLCGGASNAGGGVLRRFFPDDLLEELSRQINPETNSGLTLLPLPGPGERFPVDDPLLKPVLEPRPVSDALYLQGLLEGLAEIEARGWDRLIELGAPPPTRVISLGGGARNPQWRRLRERRLGIPVVRCSRPPAAGVARLALRGMHG